jgi:hypothetical protein
MQPLTVSSVRYCTLVKGKGGNLKENHMVFEIHRETSKSENSEDYAQKPQRNCTFMNSALANAIKYIKMLIVEY